MSYSRIEIKNSTYDSPLKKYESNIYQSPLKKYYESPAKSRYESPFKQYDPSPLHNHNKYLNPERSSMRGLSGLKYTDYSLSNMKSSYI